MPECPVAEQYPGVPIRDDDGVPRRSHHYEVANKYSGQITWRCVHCGHSPGGILTLGPQGFTP